MCGSSAPASLTRSSRPKDALRIALAGRWSALLGRQDRDRRSALHITVQNKVTPAAARALHAQLQGSFVPEHVPAVGLDVWHYEGGPWRAAAAYAFGIGGERFKAARCA